MSPEVADGPWSLILDQVSNGVAVRMALLVPLDRSGGVMSRANKPILVKIRAPVLPGQRHWTKRATCSLIEDGLIAGLGGVLEARPATPRVIDCSGLLGEPPA